MSEEIPPLKRWQREALDFAAGRKDQHGLLFFMDMGMGKTRTVLEFVANHLEGQQVHVYAPKVQFQWQEEGKLYKVLDNNDQDKKKNTWFYHDSEKLRTFEKKKRSVKHSYYSRRVSHRPWKVRGLRP